MENQFWANLAQKIKIVILSWNLETRLSRICKIQLWYELFVFLTRNTLFGQIWSQNSTLFKVKFGTQTNLNIQNSLVMFTFFVFLWKYPFWLTFIQKSEIVSLSWNSAPRLIWICRTQWWCSLYLFLTGSNLFLEICFKKLKLLKLKYRT